VPAESEYFRTSGGGVGVDSKAGARVVYFGIVLQLRRSLPDNALLLAEFENPSDPSKPLRTEYRPKSTEKSITLTSEPLSCIVNGRDYAVVVQVLEGEASSSAIGEHRQAISFRIPASQMISLGLRQCGS
jgi:hypothetical protein